MLFATIDFPRIDIAGHIPYFSKGKLNSFKETEL